MQPRIARLKSDLQPVWDAASEHTRGAAQPLLARAAPHVREAHARFDDATEGWSKLSVALAAVALTLLIARLLFAPRRAKGGASTLQRVINALKGLPVVRGLVASHLDEVAADMRKEMHAKDVEHVPVLQSMPREGLDVEGVLAELDERASKDFRYADGYSASSGAIYMSGDEHRDLLNDVYCLFSQSNPLHADMFPSVRRMEAEVVAVTASLLGGGPAGANPAVCGAMTSGGSESIVTAVFASLAYQRRVRGITEPEIVMADSAHAAYYKAASYSGARLVVVPVSTRTFAMTASDVRKRVTRNTALVITSAVTFPHGTLDDVAGIAKLCRSRSLLLHVDCCLGGYVLPFMRRLGYDVPPFDFAVNGVTSMSVDTHKYGLAHKGTSVVLYSTPELRQSQYTAITEWSGGLYVSPGIAGSRNGALIATAWAAIRHMGMEGYVKATGDIMKAAEKLVQCVESVPELRLCGKPAMCNIAFMSTSRKFDVLQLNDILSKKGWMFAPLIKPVALHFCFTLQHVGCIDQLCDDLLAACEELRRSGGAVSGGKAQLYGMAASIPDRQGVGDILVRYQDIMLSTK